MLKVHWSTKFLIMELMFLKYDFFVFILDAIFVVRIYSFLGQCVAS